MGKSDLKQTIEKSDLSWHDAFLSQLRLVPNVTKACDVANVGRATAYEHRHKMPDFAKSWDDAIDEAIERLEYEMHRRAYEGVNKPIIYQGEITDTYKEYSDTLAIFLAKAHRPEKYRERSQIVHDGGLNITISYEDENDEQMDN